MRGIEHCWKKGSLMSGGSALELTRTSMGKVTVFVPCMRMSIRPPLSHQVDPHKVDVK